MKKIVALLMVLAMGLMAFAGCQPAAPAAAPAAEKPAAEAPAAKPEAAPEVVTEVAEVDTTKLDYSTIKVGMLINCPRNDGGWCQAHDVSIIRAMEELGMNPDEQLIVVENVSDAGSDAESTIIQLIDEGCNLIFGASSGYTNAIDTCAAKYPDVTFYQFEGNTSANAASYSIRDCEAIFLLGYASALMSPDNSQLGFVAAQPQASVIRAVNSFAAGARYANPEATVQVVWTNSWYDPAKEKENANSLIASGVKAMGYHGSTTSVAQACEEAGAYCTGFHIDMHDYGPKAVLVSFMWNWTPIYKEIFTELVSGTWTNATLFLGIDAGCASISDWNADIMPADVIAKCEEVKAKCMGGEITAFEGPVKDNKGNEVLAEGKQFTDAELINMMFLLDNVVGTLP